MDVLLCRTRAGTAATKVLAHGMGGLGKTTLAAAVTRTVEIRSRFTRIGFVSAGQQPAVLELQRQLYSQLVGEVMPSKAGATTSSQRELLQAAAQTKQWLVVLDDIWQAEHEREMNFLDVAASPDAKIFVTTRFAKLLPGYVEIALGLLSEHESISLLLHTAEIVEATQVQRDASSTICKLASTCTNPAVNGSVLRLVNTKLANREPMCSFDTVLRRPDTYLSTSQL